MIRRTILADLNPAPDESLASLLQRQGALHGCSTTRDYLSGVEDPRPGEPSALLPHSSRTCGWTLLPQMSSEFAGILRLTVEQVEQASLLPLVGTVFAPDTTIGNIARSGLRVNEWAYCAPCLSTGWHKNWILPTVTDCVRHRLVLANGCPACSRAVTPLSTGRTGTTVRCACGAVLNDVEQLRAEDDEHETQRMLHAEIASNRDPRGDDIRAMFAFLETAVPAMTQIGSNTTFSTAPDSTFDRLYRFDLEPQQRPQRSAHGGGFIDAIRKLTPDPWVRRVLVHHAHLAWRDDSHRDRLAQIIDTLDVRWKSDRTSRSSALHERFAPALTPTNLQEPLRQIRELTDLPARHEVPAVIPFWEIDPSGVSSRLRVRCGNTISALFIAASTGVPIHEARRTLGTPAHLKYVVPTPTSIDSALTWLATNESCDYAHRRKTLKHLTSLTPTDWQALTGLAPPAQRDDQALAAIYWVHATCAAPSLYPRYHQMSELARQRLSRQRAERQQRAGSNAHDIRSAISAHFRRAADHGEAASSRLRHAG